MNVDFGWVLVLAGLAGAIPTGLALLRGRSTRTRWLRLIVHLLLILIGCLEIQRHRDWRPLGAPSAERSASVASNHADRAAPVA